MTCGIFLLRLARGLRRVVIVLDCKRRADAADMKCNQRKSYFSWRACRVTRAAMAPWFGGCVVDPC